MPTIFRKNFSRRQVDCAAYSGDLILEECNITQDVPDTGQNEIFINTGALTSLTCSNSNCVNHRQPPQGGVVYVNCNTGEFDYASYNRISGRINMGFVIDAELKKWWMETRDWLTLNPTATYQEYTVWFDANQSNTVFNQDTFLATVSLTIHNEFSSGVSWAEIRDWIVANGSADGFNEVIF